jgi:hypothetical protein
MPPPLRVTASIEPTSVRYGDQVTATVEVNAQGTIDPSDVRVSPSFIPYVATSGPTVRRLGQGAVSYTYTLLCVTEGCLPTRGQRLLRLEPVIVTVGEGRSTLRASGAWPTIRIVSRLTRADVSGPVRFRSAAAPPSPLYRVTPGALAVVLGLGAAICALTGIAILARELARLWRRPGVTHLSRLDLAIAYLRDSTRRSGADRRRALSLLAETTDELEPDLAETAAEAAWSRPSPSVVGATELADRAAEVGKAAR